MESVLVARLAGVASCGLVSTTQAPREAAEATRAVEWLARYLHDGPRPSGAGRPQGQGRGRQPLGGAGESFTAAWGAQLHVDAEQVGLSRYRLYRPPGGDQLGAAMTTALELIATIKRLFDA